MSTLPWSMTRLDAVADIVTGSTPATSDRSNYGQEYMFVSPADIGKGKFVRSTIKNLSEVGYSRTRHVPKGSVLFVCIGSTIGKVGIAGDDLATNQQINALIPSHAVDSDFLFYAASTLSGIVRNQAGEQAVPLVSKAQFSRFEIPTPPLVEQKRIASTISDADRLIESLERLISKKQAIKQGLMQELLSGKTRLPEFQESWVQTKIGKLASVVGGGTPSTKTPSYWNGDIPWFTPGEISKNGSGLVKSSERSITSEGLQRSGAKLLPANSILVTSRASLGHCAVAEVPVATNQGFTSLVPKDSQSSWFLYYWMQHNRHELQTRAAGSTFLEISSAKVESIPITIPSIREQEAIAEVLRDADNEINALNRRLESVRSIKQGMMQELLTGRTRLPIEEVSS